ncbi:hypothetical protein F4553_004902 [Allocatelliglobosispora scoriae]|uniref:Uncharacterized protein n=1 Tax=Allocatelliglobosispora scoriae TaxID=643052 RepID=A0A841BX77_9ACTN|nr:hypothetical protein [Allocatelliglobosispora scoriae]MBB5871523.1 hypothetical protein [Allocatelliglobosispora scoriae]
MSYPPPSSPEQPQYGAPIPPSFPPQQPPPGQPGYGQPAYGQPVPPPKKSKAGMIIGIIAGVLLLVCALCAGGFYFLYDTASDKVDEIQSSLGVTTGDKADSHTITYQVGGTGAARVTWSKSSGSTESEDAQLPWTKEFVITDDSFGGVLSVIGRDSSLDDQQVTCKVFIDGKEKSSRSGTKSAMCTVIFVS